MSELKVKILRVREGSDEESGEKNEKKEKG